MLIIVVNEYVKSFISIEIEMVEVELEKWIIVVRVLEGISKFYKDKDGLVFVKNGLDKWKVISNEELRCML